MKTLQISEMKCAPFKSYEEIPLLTREYIVYVSGEKNLDSVPLEDINGFMLMLYEFENRRQNEHVWVM